MIYLNHASISTPGPETAQKFEQGGMNMFGLVGANAALTHTDANTTRH
ncbi:MAG: hypothetical protein O3A01_05895 [bacterium]|nr:hypothetical protein [bacterium]